MSGILIEQLEKWSRDTLSLFEEVARHKNTEMIGQTYYHSIATVSPINQNSGTRLHCIQI